MPNQPGEANAFPKKQAATNDLCGSGNPRSNKQLNFFTCSICYHPSLVKCSKACSVLAFMPMIYLRHL